MKLMLFVTVMLFTVLSLAEELSGTYEFPPPDGLEGDSAIVELNRNEEGNYSAQVSVAEQTIEGKNIVVGENQFSFDIVVETPDGDMLQVYTVKLDKDEFTLSILSELGDRSQSISLKGKLVKELDGTYTFPPPEGTQGDTTKIQLTKDDDENFYVMVAVGDETIEASNVRVSRDQFSFDTEVKTQLGDMSQTWKIEIADDQATLSILADVDGQNESMTLKGKRVDEEADSESKNNKHEKL
ncbi:MAG: hypothetical protein F4W92_00825 [Gammaproteobacteria bacterium]|nr:hypothetical protein [Gammaproteobacteria bacterium]